MNNQTPKLVVYGCTYEAAMEIVWNRRLQDCEPVAEPMIGLLFPSDTEAVLFCLAFRNESVFEGSLAILARCYETEVLEFLQNQSMLSRVQQYDLLGVWFRNNDDEVAFNRELGF